MSCALRRLRWPLLLVGGLLVGGWFGPHALGQGRTVSALAGLVEDAAGAALPGATVEILSGALIGGPRAVDTDNQGRFRFSELPPGAYQVTASLRGYQTVRIEGLLLSVGVTAEVPIRMTIHAGDETVIVQADPSAIDPTASSISTILPQGYLRNIPTDRDTSHILDLAPGINIESAYGGAEESGNSYEMDGVDISDPQGGSPWSFFNFSLIDEVQLVGLGAPAEYGQFSGVVFNTVTRSGSNELSGSAEGYYTGKGLSSSSSGASDVSAQIDTHWDGSLEIGGPIRKDRLWYFASGQYVRNLQTEGGPIETARDARLFLKLSWLATPRNTVQGWFQWDHTRITGRNGDAFTPLEATAGEDNPELVGNLSWKWSLSKSSVLSLAWGGYSGYHHFDPQGGFSTPGHVDAETGVASVNAAQFGIVDRKRHQVNASFAHHATHLITGYHDFKLGGDFEHSVVRDRYGYPGGVFYSDNEGPEQDPSTCPEEAKADCVDDFFTLAYIGGGYDARGTNQRVSVYGQDSWRIRPRLTLNPGLRLDINRGKVPGGTVFRTNPLAARIGLAWDLRGDGRSVLRAHYGRYFEALYAAFYYYMDPGAFDPLTIERTFNTSGFSEVVSTNPGQQYAMDPHIRQPYLDQYVLGFDQQLPHNIVLSGTLVYRRNADLIETVSRDGIFVPVPGIVPDTGQQVTLFEHRNPGTDVLIYRNPPGLERSYRAAMVSATRRLSGNWQLQASYVYSRARGTSDNLGFDEFGTGANTPYFDGHFLDTPNSLVNADGRLTHDQTHQVKLQGTWIIPSLDLSLSANYTFHSGDTWAPRTDCLLTDDGNGAVGDGILDCHEFPQGPVRYFGEPRGHRRLVARNEIDVRVEWQHGLGGRRRLDLMADVFNLTNQTRATQVETLAGEDLGQPATLNFPRNVRFGLRFEW
jgi:outer membrane receptor protein involved in Fe transport